MMVESIRLPSAPEALEELSDMMIATAGGATPPRDVAGRYMLCRQAVLEGLPRASVPGFVVQCGSISKFIEFVTLYHWDRGARQAFVEQSFSGAATMAGTRGSVRRVDIFNDAAF